MATKKKHLNQKAIQNGESEYKLKYNADIEDGAFGSPKLKKGKSTQVCQND